MVRIRFSNAKIILLLILSLIGADIVYADSIPSLRTVLPKLTSDEIHRLLAYDLIIEDYIENSSPRLLPSGQAAMTLHESLPDRKEGTKYQTAYLIDAVRFSDTDKLIFLNRLAQLDTLSGITYYSETRSRETILFDDVYVVETPGSRIPRPVGAFSKIPKQLNLFIHIKDANFGSTWFSVSLFEKDNVFFFLIENALPMGIGPIRAFDAGDFRIAFSFNEVQEGLLVSSVSYFNPKKLASKFVDIFSAAEKRIRAISSWMAAQAIEAKITSGHR